jgi:parvulin-like peptidyl-prolyl isomerase
MMVPVFSLVLLGTPPGARSPAFETAFGFHILERHAG